jgi:ribose 5-phosphate isomerase B
MELQVNKQTMRIGIAADHGAFALQAQLEHSLLAAGYEAVDFGAFTLHPKDDFPTS